MEQDKEHATPLGAIGFSFCTTAERADIIWEMEGMLTIVPTSGNHCETGLPQRRTPH